MWLVPKEESRLVIEYAGSSVSASGSLAYSLFRRPLYVRMPFPRIHLLCFAPVGYVVRMQKSPCMSTPRIHPQTIITHPWFAA